MSLTPLPATAWSATAGTHALSAEVLLAVLLSSRSASCPASFCHLAVLIHHAKNSYKVPESQDTANDEKPHGTSHTSSSSFRSALRSTAQASSAFWFWIHLGRKLSRLVPELAMPMWSNMIQYKPISLDVLGSESHSSIDNLAIVLAPHILVERKVPPCSVRTGAGPDADRASNFKLKPVHFKMKLQHRPQHIVPGYPRPNLVMARWLLHWWPRQPDIKGVTCLQSPAT